MKTEAGLRPAGPGLRRRWTDRAYTERVLGLDGAAGEIDMAWMNVDDGAVSPGHPVGARGGPLH